MATTIDGKPTKPMPASVKTAIDKGVPVRTAFAKGPKPVSTVKVK